MNNAWNGIKNTVWLLGIMASLVAVLVGIIFAISHRYYGERQDGTLDIRGKRMESQNVIQQSAVQTASGTLNELQGSQDAGISYVYSLTYLCDSTFSALNDYASTFGSGASAQIWTAPGSPLSAANAADTMITSPSDGSQLIPANAAMVYQPRRLFIYIGLDNLMNTSEEEFTAGYKKLISDIQTASPNTSIICCSVACVAAAYTGSEGITAEKTALANIWIQNVCRETGVYFADLAALFNDSTGFMRHEYASPDGRSLSDAGINTLVTYIRMHALS